MMAWLFTFLVHGTLWCGLAWLGLRLFSRTHARLRETIWYTALAASFITPTARTLTPAEFAIWRLPMPSFVVGVEQDHLDEERAHEEAAAPAFTPSGEGAHSDEVSATTSWSASAGILWLSLAGGLLGVYFVRSVKLRRRLREREPVTHPRARQALATLSRRAGLGSPPQLTESHNLGSPIALGVGTGREICVPVRAFHELDEGELAALLGHEVAHHLRRDTIRLCILNVLQAVFFLQPLFRLAAREIHLAAEAQCDDWAASQLEDRFAMASCLTEVAGWVVRRDRSIPVPGIGRRRSQLELRVRRLMDERRPPGAPSRSGRWVMSAGLLALTPWCAPSVTPTGDPQHEDGGTLEHVTAMESKQPREREHARGQREHRVGRQGERREHDHHGGHGR